ncbi:MAG TPA: DUF5050 domain-containing protein [Pirellulales bacterium]|jgi:TolB protein
MLSLALFGGITFGEEVPRVTIATHRFGNVQLMTVGIDGSDPQQLTNEPDGATQASWSPDGTKVAYVAGAQYHGKIKIMDADGKNARVLLDGRSNQRTPQWSPDGKRIAFSMLVNRNYDLFSIDVDGNDLKTLADSPKFEADPAWSPDGSKIAYVTAADGEYPRLCLMNADGTDQKEVLDHTLNVAVYPSWTSDGKQITYGGPDEEGKVQVMQVNVDGTGNTMLTRGATPHSYAAWSPDGQYLTYVSDPGAESGDLCIYDVLTGEHRVALAGEVFQQLFRDARPAWAPQYFLKQAKNSDASAK